MAFYMDNRLAELTEHNSIVLAEVGPCHAVEYQHVRSRTQCGQVKTFFVELTEAFAQAQSTKFPEVTVLNGTFNRLMEIDPPPDIVYHRAVLEHQRDLQGLRLSLQAATKEVWVMWWKGPSHNKQVEETSTNIPIVIHSHTDVQLIIEEEGYNVTWSDVPDSSYTFMRAYRV